MKRLILLFALFCLPSLAVGDSYWQITLRYSNAEGNKIINAQKIPDLKKKISHPGLSTAVETQLAHISWYRNNERIYSSDAEVPFGYRYGQPVLSEGVSIVRTEGPDTEKVGDIVEVDFLGIKSRFGVPVDSFRPKSSGASLRYTITPRFSLRDGPLSTAKLVDTGKDSNRYVLVIVGDGYRAQDLDSGQFASDAQTIVSYLGSQSPWDELLKISNIYLINVASNQAGTDDPCAPDSGGGCVVTSVDTYFNTTFGTNNIDRALAPDSTGQSRAFAAADSFVGAGVWDSMVLIVNSSKYGGTGGTISTTSMHTSAPEIAVHELGHTIGDLADEYSDPYPGFPETITEPNVDSDGVNPKWYRWLTAGVPLPTPDEPAYDSVVGAFEGARYKTTGVYRPVRSCKMKILGVPFCPVCKEALMEGVLEQVKLYDTVSPSTNKTVKIGKKAQKYKVVPISVGSVTTSWTLCGKTLSKNATSVSVSKSKVKNSSCTLKAKITLTSDFIREKSHTKTLSWKVKK